MNLIGVKNIFPLTGKETEKCNSVKNNWYYMYTTWRRGVASFGLLFKIPTFNEQRTLI